jgi:hypothetical protein
LGHGRDADLAGHEHIHPAGEDGRGRDEGDDDGPDPAAAANVVDGAALEFSAGDRPTKDVLKLGRQANNPRTISESARILPPRQFTLKSKVTDIKFEKRSRQNHFGSAIAKAIA